MPSRLWSPWANTSATSPTPHAQARSDGSIRCSRISAIKAEPHLRQLNHIQQVYGHDALGDYCQFTSWEINEMRNLARVRVNAMGNDHVKVGGNPIKESGWFTESLRDLPDR